jgi:dolichyl-phosphate-mannose--protein O-mannosyl transferase
MTLEELVERRFPLLLALLTAVALALRYLWLADTPPDPDSVTSAVSAFDYMLDGKMGGTMWHHPKLRSILLFASLKLWGGTAWGLNMPSIVMGTLSVTVMALVVRQLTASSLTALFGAFLLAVDSVHIDFSRQAIQEVYMPFFTLLGIWLALRYREGAGRWALLLSGAAFGLGLAGKWYVLFPLAVTLAYLLWLAVVGGRGESGAYREWLYLVLSLTLIPLAVYLLTYLPWLVHRGYGLSDLLDLHRLMSRESLTHQGFNPLVTEDDTKPLLWFVRPAGFADFAMQGNMPVVFVAITNPLVWSATIPAFLVAGRDALRGNRALLFPIALFLVSYAPLISLTRPLWLHTALAVVPFAFMLIAHAAVLLARRLRHGTALLALYALAVVVSSAPLYLLAIGKGYSSPLLRPVIERYRPANERQGGSQP